MSDYIPTTHKFVAILNKKVPIGNLMNALAHATAGLVGDYPELADMRFGDYFDANNGKHPSISDNPFIILAADNSNKLRTFRQALIENDIHFTDFTSSMTVGTYAEQQERTKATVEADLEYYAVVAFGETEKLQQLTKKFSLWR
jgi:hypothetical protein